MLHLFYYLFRHPQSIFSISLFRILQLILLVSSFRIQHSAFRNRLIFVELDGLLRTLVDAGPALDTLFGMDGVRFVIFHLINFTGTDLNTVATTLAYISIHYGIHIQNFKFRITLAF